MARKSRKTNPLLPVSAPVQPERQIYKAGGYCRLPVRDSGKPGADTIDAQNKLIREYIESQPDMEFAGLYSDNGWSGTNFKRPEFERMMEDVKRGKIDCVVVKDLSRFGLNYLEAGNYLDKIFPFMGVRFVAVQDNFDTLTTERTGDGYVVYLKNILNDAYSKDISRKVCPALALKQQRGEFIGDWAAYGYRKCADDSHRIEPDPETTPIVRDIFQWRLSGMSYTRIARRLNELDVPSPMRYLYQKGVVTAERFAHGDWTITTVKKILSREVYIGNMVQGRKRSAFREGQKQRAVPQSEWIIVKNTHEPLIDEDTFRTAQEIAEKAANEYKSRLGRYDDMGTTPNILKGLVYCADCGLSMERHKTTNRGASLYYVFTCRTHSRNPKGCPKKYVRESVVKEEIRNALRIEIAQSENAAQEVRQRGRSETAAKRERELDAETIEARKALDRASRLYESLYQSYVDRLISEREYMSMRERYRKDMEAAQTRLDAVEKRRGEERRQTAKNPWMDSFSAFQSGQELTAEMARELLERVEIDAENHITVTLRYREERDALIRRLEQEEAKPV